MYVGLVFLAYFGVCGVFCSVAGSWVVKIAPPNRESGHFRGNLLPTATCAFSPRDAEIPRGSASKMATFPVSRGKIAGDVAGL